MALPITAWQAELDESLHATEMQAACHDLHVASRKLVRPYRQQPTLEAALAANAHEFIRVLTSLVEAGSRAESPTEVPAPDAEKGPVKRDPSDLAAEIKRIADGLAILVKKNDNTKSHARQWLHKSQYIDMADFIGRAGIDDVLSFQRHMAAHCPAAHKAVFGDTPLTLDGFGEPANPAVERPCDSEPAAETHGDMS